MKKQLKRTTIFLVISFLTSCGQSDQKFKEKDVIVKQKREQIKISNEKAIINLSQRYNAVLGWDSLDFYTYHLQEIFIDKKKLLCFEGELEDITKKDSSYYLKVKSTYRASFKKYVAQISLNHQAFAKLQKVLKTNNFNNKGCFIVKVSQIISVSPEIKSESEYDGEESSSFLYYDFNESLLIFKGELIDFYFKEEEY